MEMKTTVLTDRLRFPESPRWYEGKLWFSDMFTNQVMNVDLQGRLETVTTLEDTPIGLGWTPEGQLLVVSAFNRHLLKLNGDHLVEVADLSKLVSYPCNDMVIDAQGRAYIGNIGFDFGNPQAAPQLAPILLVAIDGSIHIAADGLAFPNGMVITPDGQTLVVAESYAARLTAFIIKADGSLGKRRTWAQFNNPGDFSNEQITPDGICLDAEGAVWIATPNTKEVIRVREGGEITHHIPVDTIPLACILGGADRRTLFITTSESQDPGDTQAKGRIETVQVDVSGAGLP